MILFLSIADPGVPEQKHIEVDESLFPRIAEGDKEAFICLYDQSWNAVFSYALSLLRNYEDAEDAAQDTFLKIRSAAHLYKPMGKPMAWVITITRNICLMRLREQKKNAAWPMDDLGSAAFGDAEDRLVLAKAMEQLAQDECQIIFLHAVSGLRHREIAGIVGMPLNTVLSKYRRGLKKLRQSLEENM
jgi:RNA polymerase sigma-70 factor (ECF subfamily)